MTGTVGLELTNFLNPNLTWKKVSKGNRSATRRNRKPVAKIVTAGVELADKSPRRAEDATVSDSEKLGVAVLGRRFSDKMEHVPIKKRKYNFRSPSPPPRTPSPHNNVTQHGSCQGSSPNSSGKGVHMAVDTSTSSIISPHGVDGKVLEAMNVKLDFREDFSGIEMLADAVCSDSFDVNVDHTVENPVTESVCRENESAMLKEETGVSLETINISPKDMTVEDIVENSSFQDSTTHIDEQTSPSLEDNKVEGSVSLCNDRLHWDLNIVMDDWQTANVQTNNPDDSSVDKSEKLNILKSGEIDRETGETNVANNDDMVNNLVSSEVHGKTDLHSDSRGSSFGPNRQDNQLDACSGLDHNHDECGADGKPFAQVVRIEKCLSNVPCPSNMASSTSPSFLEEKTKKGVIEDKIAFVENVQVEEHDVASPFIPVVDGVTHEVDGTVLKIDGEDSARASTLQEVSSIENCLPTVPLMVEPVCEVEKVGVSYVPLRCEDVSTSSAPVEEVQPIIAEEKNPLPEETFPSHTSEIDSSVHAGSEEAIHVSSGNFTATVEPVSGFTNHEDCIDYAPPKGLGEIVNEDPNNRICESDPSQNDKGHVIGTENSRELQAGYDSQFEDGELRETDVRCWDENEGNSAEIEQVDYESECDGERLCVSEAECSENKMKFESGSTKGCGDVTKKIEECTIGAAAAAAAASGDHLTCSKIRTLEATDGSKLNKDTVDCEGGANSQDIGSEVVGSRECKRGLLLLTEGSLSSDTIQRSGSDNCDDIFPRPKRESASKSMERDRSAVQIHCRNPGGGDGHIVNRHQSPTYDTLYGSGCPRPRSIIESCGSVVVSDPTISEATGVEAAYENRVCRQYLSSSSNSVYRPLNRRSLAYRDDINGIHGGTGPVRDGNNPDRSRFKRYPQGFSRDIREDYHRPMSNYSTDHMPHRFARRERSISPVGGGRLNYAQPYKKSQSRSRSRSPTSGLLLREQNEGSRNEGSRRCSSRSPNFRSVRMDGVSLPFQKRFAADFEEGRFSPQHNTQFDDRIPAPDNFRSPNFRSARMERVRLPCQKHFAADYDEGFISPPRKRFSPQHHSQFYERLDNFRSSNFRSVRTDRERLPFQKHFAADEGYISPPRKCFSPQHHSQFDDRISAQDNFRSPNFRSVRMERARLPFQKHFSADDEEGFISPPRKRFSPQHNSQFDDRISAPDNFRSSNFRSVRTDRARLPFQKHFEADYEEGFISPPRKRFSPQHHSQFDERIPALDNFRSVRTDRARLPFQKHFAADDEGYISPPRKRLSPQNNSRFDESIDNFRDGKSPVRNFRQGQRFDSVRSSRPIGHPRRFPDMGGAGRVYKYEGGGGGGGGGDDRRKPGSRFDMIPRVRRFDDSNGGVGRQMITTEDE